MMTVSTDLAAEVRGAADGDREAFARLVEAHQSMVCSVAYAVTGDFALSEEIAQEAFIRAWRSLPQLREPTRVSGWLAAIARNEARNALARRGREALARAAIQGVAQEPEESAEAFVLRAERAQITWDAVSRLPEAYRESLVLYYREGESIRDVARLLDVTEDCVKQRLSRGRKLLQDRLAALVEETLRDTRARDGVLSIAVLAALPAFAAPAAVAKSIAAAAMAKPAAKVVGAGVLSGFTGAVVGMTGGFFGMWMGIKNAQTLNLRRYMLRVSAVTYAFVWVFLGYEAACGALLWRDPIALGIACGAGWALYLPLLFLLITWGNRKARQIQEADEAGSEPGIACNLAAAWRTLAWAMPAAVLGSAAVVLWVHSLPVVSVWWGVGFACISHFIFWRLFTRGAAIARDELVFAETAPKRAAPSRGEHGVAANPKVSVWNDVFALAGAILGGAAPIVAGLLEDGDPAWAIVLIVQCAVIFAGMAAIKAWRARRNWILFAALVVAGQINAAALFLKPLPWLAVYVQAPEEPVGLAWRAMSAAIVFGVYFVIGLVVLVAAKPQHGQCMDANGPR